MRSMSHTVVALVVAFAAVTPAVAADYFVKNGGSNANDGLSVAAAWATLNHAADVVNPGDTVHVLDGSYQGFDLRRSGTPGNPITFIADGPNVQITADNGVTPDGINVENAAHVVIDGFIVNNRTRAGIRAAVSDFITVRNCKTGFNGVWGIFTGFVDDFTVENNETYGSIDEHGIYVSNSGDRPIIRNNYIHDNNANGIHMNGDASQGGDGIISDALVEENVIHGNGAAGGSGINMDGVTDSLVRNNLLYDNHASGISLYRIDGGSGSTGNVVVNNTIINAADGRWAVNISNGSSGNTILNNILYTFHSFRGAITIDTSSRPGFVSDHHSVMDRFSINGGSTVIGLSAWQALGYDANSFIAVPADHFLTPGSDFHLLATSPAIDTGTASNAPAFDLDGNPRPLGGGFDVGVYESTSLTCNDGNIDVGEQCGEPGLPACGACTVCQQCVCAPTTPVCGDAVVCGAEECEEDGDCSGGQVCQGCACVNPPLCTSGISIDEPRLKLRANPFFFKLSGEAVIPKPWSGVNPAANGIRVVVDEGSGSSAIDLTVPGGPLWRVNNAGTKWTYSDSAGTNGGVTRVLVKDRSSIENGRLKLSIKAGGGTAVLPDVGDTRTTIVLGDADECAAIDWNPPSGPRPSCDGDASAVRCR